MELTYKNTIINKHKLSFSIKHGMINGIYSKDIDDIYNLLTLNDIDEKKLSINNQLINHNSIIDYKKKISYIPKEYNNLFFTITVHDRLKYEIKRKELVLKNEEKKIVDSQKIVGLNKDYLNRNINTLSSREKKLLQFAIALLSNPDLIMIEEPFIKLDMKNEKKLFLLLQKLKEKYNKTIVFYTNNTDILYKYCDHIVIIDNNYEVITGSNKEIFQRSEILKKHGIEIPEIIEITNKAKKKKVKLDYHKDVRDIIKDIYKHV